MAVVDVVKLDFAPGVFARKFPSEELSTWTQLIVSESQEAILLKEGEVVGPFRAGRHTLNTANYPGLIKILKTVTGKSPFTAEVWFIQKAFKLDIKWGTAGAIQLEDPKYHIMLPVRAFGQYGITVDDSAKFLFKLVGTLPAFVEKTLSNFFKGIVVTRAKDLIAKYLVEKGISILQISAHLNNISNTIEQQVSEELADYGVRIVNFNVNSISTDDNDPAVKKLKEALASKAEMDILGYNYLQKRSFDTMQTAAGNQGAGGSIINAGMGMGMGMGMGVPMGNAMTSLSQNLQTTQMVSCSQCGQNVGSDSVFCPRCGHNMKQKEPADNNLTECPNCHAKSAPGAKFCPHCGTHFRCCPACGANNSDDAVECRSCKKALPIKCPACGAEIDGTLKFCCECGAKLQKNCSSCGEVVPRGMKFCPNCGNKID